MAKSNGNGNHHTQIPEPAARPRPHTPHTEVFREVSQIKMTSIVCTPARLVDLLEHFDGTFTLRETTFNFGSRASAQLEIVHLQRHELEKLGNAIPRLLAERAPSEEEQAAESAAWLARASR